MSYVHLYIENEPRVCVCVGGCWCPGAWYSQLAAVAPVPAWCQLVPWPWCLVVPRCLVFMVGRLSSGARLVPAGVPAWCPLVPESWCPWVPQLLLEVYNGIIIINTMDDECTSKHTLDEIK